MPPSTIVIGAGPAGLSAAYHLSKLGFPVTVLESDPQYVGGISRTVQFKGFHFDIGGHRFFSKSERIEALWREILPNDFLERPRSSRILYNGHFFAYPLKPMQALFDLGVFESVRCVLSYAYARLRPIRNPRSFEEWVTNEFGSRLYQIFFKTYTEKVWGMSCTDISADWAAQRIKGVSLFSAVMSALTPAALKGGTIKSLISTFRYPRLGPGMLWDACANAVREQGGTVTLGRTVVDLRYDEATRKWTVGHTAPSGDRQELSADHVISSAPLREIAQSLSPAPSATLTAAAKQLGYRDFLTVALVLKERERFADNWIYVHDSSVKVGRIQNFKSWSPEMVPDPSLTCYGLEYFCFEGDGLWTSTDTALIARASDELVKLGLADRDDVLEGCVVRQRKAYPVYDDAYATHVQTIRDELAERYPNLHLVGRNGMHKYNNQDHAMMTALLTAENIVAGQALHDPWRVNEDAEYHEEVGSNAGASGLRAVPTRVGVTQP
ncbi:NAD(P)/FAD-dependent oxidoreductase [Gemmatimonas groenlandica]|uniref:NAD(P)/FAD-dependent oxidoreductase n=1 Tax=Gemmatimonas groenlandica TaxID=2732249 RepID=A0A6M4IUB0_9BACT|nr:NAD(P)/FAD-dependent oxidoreductase [Gemmatimonas groenlandica]QJR37765.1 NAD(P)/FAD-dependent oxidoreductase [Gemmatimonas groenlandica]